MRFKESSSGRKLRPSSSAPPLPSPKVLLGYKSMSCDCRRWRRWGLFLVHASVTGIHSDSPPAIWCDQFRRPRRRLSRLRSSTHPPLPDLALLGGGGLGAKSMSYSHVVIHFLPWHFISHLGFFSLPPKNILSFAFIPPLPLLHFFFLSCVKKGRRVDSETCFPNLFPPSCHADGRWTINQRGALGHLA